MPSPEGLFGVDGDAVLVQRVLAGEEAAYGVLMGRYRDRFGRYATHFLGDQHEAEDALQEAFVRGYRFLHQCEAPERVGAWLFRILVNRCRTSRVQNRRRSQEVPVETAAENDGAVTQLPVDTGWRDEIDRALARLPQDLREAFLLKHVEDLSYEEMEQLTGAGTSALKMRVKRACDKLRDLLQETHDFQR
ncbi:MAG TPA: RNA polymerase sigma factor [Gemmatimonadales bacterium]|nr:RNA polymerase sigma factor [Gemmatimonadales bacterium]